jgi:hypothetical protein
MTLLCSLHLFLCASMAVPVQQVNTLGFQSRVSLLCSSAWLQGWSLGGNALEQTALARQKQGRQQKGVAFWQRVVAMVNQVNLDCRQLWVVQRGQHRADKACKGMPQVKGDPAHRRSLRTPKIV